MPGISDRAVAAIWGIQTLISRLTNPWLLLLAVLTPLAISSHAETPLAATPTATPTPTWAPCSLTEAFPSLKFWKDDKGQTLAYIDLWFPYESTIHGDTLRLRISSPGTLNRTGNDFSADLQIERDASIKIEWWRELSQIYPLGALSDGDYTFTLYSRGELVLKEEFSIGKPKVKLIPLRLQTRPVFTDMPTTLTETESGPRGFSIIASGDLTRPLVVKYTISGNATNGVDYQSIPTSVSLTNSSDYYASYSGQAEIVIHPLLDSQTEVNETITLTLDDSPDYQMGEPSSATLVLTDIPQPTPTPTPIISFPPIGSPIPWVPGGLPPKSGFYNGIRTWTLSGSTYVQYIFSYGSNGEYVAFWDTAVRKGSSFTVSPLIQVFAGLHGLAVTTFAHTYDLGPLDFGDYDFMAYPFSVGPVQLSITPRIERAYFPNLGQVLSAQPEGNLTGFTITRTGELNYPLNVPIHLGGSATNGVDYDPITSTTLTIPAGQTYTDIPIHTLADNDIEGTETVTLTLGSGAGYQLAEPVRATLSILDDWTWNPASGHYSRPTAHGTQDWDGIQLISPRGSNTFDGGQDIALHWKTNPPLAGTAVRFELWREGAKLADLGSDQNASGEGTAAVRLPEVERDAPGCQIRLYSTKLSRDSQKPDYITSDPFTITAANTHVPLGSWGSYH